MKKEIKKKMKELESQKAQAQDDLYEINEQINQLRLESMKFQEGDVVEATEEYSDVAMSIEKGERMFIIGVEEDCYSVAQHEPGQLFTSTLDVEEADRKLKKVGHLDLSLLKIKEKR